MPRSASWKGRVPEPTAATEADRSGRPLAVNRETKRVATSHQLPWKAAGADTAMEPRPRPPEEMGREAWRRARAPAEPSKAPEQIKSPGTVTRRSSNGGRASAKRPDGGRQRCQGAGRSRRWAYEGPPADRGAAEEGPRGEGGARADPGRKQRRRQGCPRGRNVGRLCRLPRGDYGTVVPSVPGSLAMLLHAASGDWTSERSRVWTQPASAQPAHVRPKTNVSYIQTQLGHPFLRSPRWLYY